LTRPPPEFTIRTLETHDDYRRAEEAQRTMWGMQDNLGVVPLHVLITAQKNGGLVGGAFDGDDRMIGFIFGFLGLTKTGRFKHCSHLLGIEPTLRRSGLGEAMKRFQYEYVRAQGIDLITWTFDPLEGVNASLNIRKLRAVARIYYENLYGNMDDGLNAGLPSDRFEVEWWVGHPRVTAPYSQCPMRVELIESGAQVLNPAIFVEDIPHPPSLPDMTTLPRTVLVEVPAVYQTIKQRSMTLAREWRLHTRELIKALFARDYVLADFIVERAVFSAEAEQQPARNFYVFEQGLSLPEV
jgi:predicted GNAT superfamily acetyltransferase